MGEFAENSAWLEESALPQTPVTIDGLQETSGPSLPMDSELGILNLSADTHLTLPTFDSTALESLLQPSGPSTAVHRHNPPPAGLSQFSFSPLPSNGTLPVRQESQALVLFSSPPVTKRPIGRKWATEEEWSKHKDEICRLYQEEDKTLAVVMELMEKQHGLQAT